MTNKELTPDNIYYVLTKEGYEKLFYFNGYEKNGSSFKMSYILNVSYRDERPSTFELNTNGYIGFSEPAQYRIATQNEKDWIIACLNANYIIPKPFNNCLKVEEYSIYN